MLKQHLKLALTFAGLVLAMMSCTSHYRIDGVVETFGYEGRELSLIEFLPYRTTKYDSCIVNHGRFQMKGKADTTRLVFLCKDGSPIIPVYIEKGHAKVRLLPTEMTVSGTRQNDLFYSFLKKKIEIDNRFEDLSQRRLSMSRSGFDARTMELIQDSLRMVVDECEEMICSFMAENYKEPAAVGVFMMLSAGPSNGVSPLVKRILDAAPDDFLSQSYVNGYTDRVGYDRSIGSVN
ncbi:MAG: DUF4369 domain-containing protein [Bacteroidaceae bacterium]|nr:DUF4369 domain-containing protein [Bacteroidaceae bacterium]